MMMKTLLKINFLFLYCISFSFSHAQNFKKQIIETLKDQDLKEASWALQQLPITVTAETCSKSTGGVHDFFSQADYFWPDPEHPDGPYINRDGLTNPDNFVAHRLAMIRFSKIIASLASAYILTHDEKYVRHAITHVSAWFVNEDTKMNPDLQYAQAVVGKATGRCYGIIDTIHLMEVAQGIRVMFNSPSFDVNSKNETIRWFQEYLKWLTTHPHGVEEMNTKNNHSTCWTMQVATFAKLTGQKELLDFCIDRYKNVLLPNQMGSDGSFPLEIKRTKPYGYSIFNLDAMAMVCQILSTKENDLWHYQIDGNKSIDNGIKFLYPYIEDKSKWPFEKDVMYWDDWPVAQPALVFGAVEFKNKQWLQTWKKLDHSPQNGEVIRNLPVRHPIIWLN
jgi:hypothetical protein